MKKIKSALLIPLFIIFSFLLFGCGSAAKPTEYERIYTPFNESTQVHLRDVYITTWEKGEPIQEKILEAQTLYYVIYIDLYLNEDKVVIAHIKHLGYDLITGEDKGYEFQTFTTIRYHISSIERQAYNPSIWNFYWAQEFKPDNMG